MNSAEYLTITKDCLGGYYVKAIVNECTFIGRYRTNNANEAKSLFLQEYKAVEMPLK